MLRRLLLLPAKFKTIGPTNLPDEDSTAFRGFIKRFANRKLLTDNDETGETWEQKEELKLARERARTQLLHWLSQF